MKEETIEKQFNEIIGNLTDKQFDKWIKTWFDEQNYMDIINDWEIETKQEELKNLKKMFKLK